MTRRNALRGLASIPVGLTLSSLFSCRQTPLTSSTSRLDRANVASPLSPCTDPALAGAQNPGLNVYLHGLFVISMGAAGIDLFAPRVTGHSYGAGSWLSENPLQPGFTYRLGGINAPGSSVLTADPASDFLVPKPQAAKFVSSSSYFKVFHLPLPARTVSRARTIAKPAQTNFFTKNKPCRNTTSDDYGMQPTSIPIVYVFTYLQDQFAANTLENAAVSETTAGGVANTLWTFKPQPADPLSYDLHLFAEPLFASDTHRDDALQSFCRMFSTPLALCFEDNQNLHSAKCVQEQDLQERQKPLRAGEVFNCASFILGS